MKVSSLLQTVSLDPPARSQVTITRKRSIYLLDTAFSKTIALCSHSAFGHKLTMYAGKGMDPLETILSSTHSIATV